jgi:hypothetical protein
MSQVIETKVLEFASKNLMFTSVDIANSIKKDGTWVKNREVAHWLRTNALTVALCYTSTPIQVGQGAHTATLYHPTGTNPDDYTDRDQEAIPPPHVPQSVSTTPAASVVSPQIPAPAQSKKLKIRPDNDGRLRIPAALVSQLGWKPGDKVDKSKILVNNKDVSEELIVHKDGRIAFHRSHVAWGDGPVMVFFSNGHICFEKP